MVHPNLVDEFWLVGAGMGHWYGLVRQALSIHSLVLRQVLESVVAVVLVGQMEQEMAGQHLHLYSLSWP